MSPGRIYAPKPKAAKTTAPSSISRPRSHFGSTAPERPPPSLPFQAKLEVGAVDDPLEREADRLADRVMRMPEPVSTAGRSTSSGLGEALQRKCAGCDEEDPLRRKGEGALTGAAAAPPIVHEVLGSPGQPLDASARAFMEPRFGFDFSRVRVHADARGADSARAVGARAYTVGSNIVFREAHGSFNTSDSRRLLAHELAHVVQQRAAGPARLSRAPDEQAGPSAPGAGSAGAAAPSAQVYFCSKPVVLGQSHAFFRVGGPNPGNPTFELEHDEPGEHCPCGFQGWPERDYPEDRDYANAPCTLLPGVTPACLEANHFSYPIGRYCALGPNSNTYARWLAERCGAPGARPPGDLPGFDDSPPARGTAAPMWFPGTGVVGTLGLCGSISCDNDACTISD